MMCLVKRPGWQLSDMDSFRSTLDTGTASRTQKDAFGDEKLLSTASCTQQEALSRRGEHVWIKWR